MRKLLVFVMVLMVMIIASSPPIKAHDSNTNTEKDNIDVVVLEQSVLSFEATKNNTITPAVSFGLAKKESSVENLKYETGVLAWRSYDRFSLRKNSDAINKKNAIGGASQRIWQLLVIENYT